MRSQNLKSESRFGSAAVAFCILPMWIPAWSAQCLPYIPDEGGFVGEVRAVLLHRQLRRGRYNSQHSSERQALSEILRA